MFYYIKVTRRLEIEKETETNERNWEIQGKREKQSLKDTS